MGVQGTRRHLVAYERVLCLECGHEYSKPAAAGTMNSNPGCPHCGYLGWIALRRDEALPAVRSSRRAG